MLGPLLSPAVSVRSPEPAADPSGHDPRLAGEILLGLVVAAVLVGLARAAVRRVRR